MKAPLKPVNCSIAFRSKKKDGATWKHRSAVSSSWLKWGKKWPMDVVDKRSMNEAMAATAGNWNSINQRRRWQHRISLSLSLSLFR